MSDSPHSPQIDTEYFDRALEQIRTKLLDKTRRNRLLNFKESARDIAVIDEMPNQVHEHLVLEGASFCFLPLPDPDGGEDGAEDEPSRELPSENHGLQVERRHRDAKLQTPFRQKELDRRLRRLFLEHRTIIEETGANNLYLAMGFLRWRDDQEETLFQLAPLMLVPVRFEREGRAGAARYHVVFDDEALDTNYSLFEKLKHSFDMTLPFLSDDHIPEDYWREVDEAIEKKKKEGWQVIREMTFGLFRFQKQVMWRDLDPKRWPRHSPLVDKELVRRILVGPRSGESSPGILTETYRQDDPGQPSPSVRLIRDADSSQYAALVDALTREDGLVIEGPPGTGKSQTIANLIAAALADGKTVLFVAEKMAALEVVYRRLEESKLGDFCLQLHGLKTGKKELLKSVETRMNRRERLSDNLHRKRQLLENVRKELIDTSKALSVTAGPLELPLYNIVWRVERLRQALPEDFTPVELPDPSSLSFSDFTKAKQQLEDLGSEWTAIPENARQAWSGFRPLRIADPDVRTLTAAIQECVSAITHLQEWLASSPAGPILHNAKVPKILALSKHSVEELLPPLPDSISDELVFRILYDDLVAPFELLLESIDGYLRKVGDVNQTFDFASTNADTYVLRLQDHALPITGVACSESLRIKDLREEFNLFSQVIEDLATMSDKALPVLRLVRGFARTVSDCEDLSARAGKLTRGPDSLFRHATPIHSKPVAKALLHDAQQRSIEVLERTRDLEDFILNAVGETSTLRDSVRQVTQRRDALAPILYSEYRSAKRHIRSLMKDPKRFSRKPEFLKSLAQLEDFCLARDEFASDSDVARALGSLFKGIETNWDQLSELVQFSKNLRKSLGAEKAQEILSDWPSHVDQMQVAGDALGIATRRIREFASSHSFPPTLWQRPLDEIAQTLRPWAVRIGGACDILLQPWCNPQRTLGESLQAARSYWDAKSKQREIETNTQFDFLLKAYWRGPDTQPNRLREAHDWIACRLGYRAIDRHLLLTNFTERGALDRSRLEKLLRRTSTFSSAVEAHVRRLENFGSIELTAWMDGAEADLDRFLDKLRRCTGTVQSAPLIARWEARRESATHIGLGAIAESLTANRIRGDQCGNAFDFSVHGKILKSQIAAVPILSKFGNETYEGLRGRFAELDKAMLELAAGEIAADLCRVQPPEGIGSGPVKNYTETRLLRHEANKRRRHIPLRQLVARASNSLQLLKPCFLMSPLSVSQFLPPGKIQFDLVVMDEASQIRPEDALGSIARGRRAIIVGDPKQLPPSSFFDTAIAEDEDAEETIVDDTESILDVCLKQFPFRRLRWHYRSEHEDLIRFSNESFYEGDLIIFPSPRGDSREFGVHSKLIETPSYKRGRNLQEARVVVDNIVNHFRRTPSKSLGVAAFNKRQAEEIELLLEQTRQVDPALDELISDSSDSEPLFIKNLENVQGDERDVIFISVTYGPERTGERSFQRFGPINSDLGWRRLNVIATRARQRVEVFSSMRPTDVLVGEKTSRGVRAFRSYLEYAETGRVQSYGRSSGGVPDSEFEEAVGTVVKNLGYDIEPQVGVEGFFIDIGIRHPDRPGEFLMGLECDGKTYHSSPSVRDRDRLRQEILEGKGWFIHRIWSTSWFHARMAEIDRLARAIKQRLEEDRRAAPPPSRESAIVMPEEQDIQESQDTISEALNRFWDQNIKPQFPERQNGILSEEMVEFLSRGLPKTKEEWFRTIPIALREKLDRRQITFLPDIFDLICEYA